MGMSYEEKKALYLCDDIGAARERLNLCYLLSDVVNSYLMYAIPTIEKAGLCLNGNEKHKWNLFVKSVKQLKATSAAVATLMYNLPTIGSSVETYDAIADLLLLIHDRTGDCPEHLERIGDYVRDNFASALGSTNGGNNTEDKNDGEKDN